MGARELLDVLVNAGLTVQAIGGSIVITPASLLTDSTRAAIRAAKPELLTLLTGPAITCAACTHLLPRGTCGKPIEAGLIPEAEGYGIAWPDLGHAAACSAFEAGTGKATDRPYKLAPADADVAHAEPWDDGAIARFEARVASIRRRGFDEQDAEDLAEHLHLRDVHADYRVLCLECRHVSGTVATGLLCDNHKAADVGRALPADLVTMFQSCAGFSATAP